MCSTNNTCLVLDLLNEPMSVRVIVKPEYESRPEFTFVPHDDGLFQQGLSSFNLLELNQVGILARYQLVDVQVAWRDSRKLQVVVNCEDMIAFVIPFAVAFTSGHKTRFEKDTYYPKDISR